MKTAIFCICGSNNWETVENRWVHAASGLASTELSFHPCNILRDNRRGVSWGNKNVVKIAIFGLTHWVKHRITGKLLKIDRYILRGRRWVWQVLNCLSIHATYCVIIAGASPGETKNVGGGTWKWRFFCTCGSNNWETVEDRWVHAARQFVSIEFSFHPYNI